ICSIEVLKPIRYITFKRNEVKSKASRISDAAPWKSCICVEDDRTQRQSVVLRDVRYRVTAEMVPRPDFAYPTARLLNQFERRVEKGQCFLQPSMGTREFPAYFEAGSSSLTPIDLDLDLGYMLYDVFNLNDWKVGKTAESEISIFHAALEHGVLMVPPYDSPLVKKPGKENDIC
ncbi:MAG: type I-E CRISPR-associated protein Cas5/CasD, partial [Clostridia bacterium]